MRKQTAYAEKRAAEERNITEKSRAIRAKMEEKAARVDAYTTSSGKLLAYGGMVLSGVIAGAIASHFSVTLVLVLCALVVVATGAGAGYFFLQARDLIKQPVARHTDGTPLLF